MKFGMNIFHEKFASSNEIKSEMTQKRIFSNEWNLFFLSATIFNFDDSFVITKRFLGIYGERLVTLSS